MTQRLLVPERTLDKVVKYVEVSSALTKRALDQNAVLRAGQEKAASLRAPLLKHMIDAGVVAPHQKEAAEVMLGSFDSSLQLLKSAVDKIVELKAELQKQAGEPGKSEGDEKQASDGTFDSLTNPHVGQRTSLVRESDKKLLALIGK